MKNIHLLPTDKPSRLFLKENTLLLNNQYTLQEVFPKGKCQNIYITSDEEIKMGDWHLVWLRDKWEVLNYMPSIGYRKECLGKEVCKIILTTDQDLIKDGVQAIPDEFLEWFVKNPSCEWVEVEIESKFDRVDGHYHDVWEIIIPKEEPKQDLLHKCTCLRPQTNCFSGMCSYCNRQIVKNLTTEDLKQKQETLEEAGMYQQELFNYLCDLGLVALQSEMQEIERIVLGMQQEQDKNKYSELVDLLERLTTIYKEDSDLHQKYDKQRLNRIEQFKNK